MHMADALVSPAVGGSFWAAGAALLAWSARTVRRSLDGTAVPLMGVLGAFVFAAQMLNFAIPGTGSSGHLGGGLLLAVLLGPSPAFLVIASVLAVQALFFADGGLLALGCNMFNMGFLPAFVAYPLVYRPLARAGTSPRRIWIASFAAAIVALQLGAFSVVVQTAASGISDLPLGTFVLFMSPIHLAIGVVEGLATGAIVFFVARTRPELLARERGEPGRALLAAFLIAAVALGGGLAWLASTRPDGLEWSIAKARGLHEPDAAAKTGTSAAGLVGGALTLLLAIALGFIARPKRRTAP